MKTYYQSPVGILELTENDGYISSLQVVDKSGVSDNNPLLDTATKQLDEYFAGERKDFDLPLKQAGTDFQQKSWSYLLSIPYGQTVTYKEQALAVDSPKGYRAVGSANGKNHIAIIVPCHRVVNSGGGLGGYAYGLDVKIKLLELEQNNK